MANLSYALLQEPDTKETLKHVSENGREMLVSPSNRSYEIKDGVIRFLQNDDLTGNNLRYQKLYDRLAPIYDLTTRMYAFFKDGSEEQRVGQYMDVLEVKNGDKVIEISIGTGRNIAYLKANAEYYGVDISLGMLKHCRRTMTRLKRPITLIQAEAEELPIMDNTFDVVFSGGGFNFFNNKQKAIEEMLRIAKNGTKLMIYDETEKVRNKFDNTLVAGNFYHGVQVDHPVQYVPDWCRDVEYREICHGELYALTFWKP